MGPIQEKLESMAGEVTTVMDQQLQVERKQIGNIIKSRCPTKYCTRCICLELVGVDGGCSGISVPSCDEEE